MSSLNSNRALQKAKKELEEEYERILIDEYKEKLREQEGRSLLSRLFPYRIKIIKVNYEIN